VALRGGPYRRLPGNPMGSVLRDMDRRARATTRRARPTRREKEPQEEAERPALAVAEVVATGEDGRARWRYPQAFPRPPVLAALPVDPAPGQDGGTVLVALEEVTARDAVVRVWRTRPVRGSGVVEPAGPGLRVHLTATPRTR
jgi:hypothetical protein